MAGPGRVDAVPEQEVAGILPGERLVERDASGRHVRQPVTRMRQDDAVDDAEAVEYAEEATAWSRTGNGLLRSCRHQSIPKVVAPISMT